MGEEMASTERRDCRGPGAVLWSFGRVPRPSCEMARTGCQSPAQRRRRAVSAVAGTRVSVSRAFLSVFPSVVYCYFLCFLRNHLHAQPGPLLPHVPHPCPSHSPIDELHMDDVRYRSWPCALSSLALAARLTRLACVALPASTLSWTCPVAS